MNRVALVTGATGVLGSAIAVGLAEAGCDVAVHYRSDPWRAAEVAEEVTSRGRRVTTVHADLEVDDIDGAAGSLLDRSEAALGPVDVLVLNAASQEVTPWADLTSAAWDGMYRATLRATAALLGVGSARMTRADRGPVVVVIGSVEAYRPAAGHAPYAVMKAGVHHLVAAAAHELGRSGIRVVGVAPGLVNRPGLGQDWPEGLRRWQSVAALGRPVEATEVAAVVAFMASPEASAVTGVTVAVDAGWGAHPGW